MGNDLKNRPEIAAQCQTPPDESSLADADCRIPLERYRVFIEDIGDGFYETNIAGDFVFFNDALCRIFGHPPDEIQGRNYADFMDRNNADTAFSDFNRIFKTGIQSSDIVWQIRRNDGETRILEISASLIKNEAGHRTGFRQTAAFRAFTCRWSTVTWMPPPPSNGPKTGI